jgi:gliding motility-associated-like protein
MGHILKSGMMALMALTASVNFAQQASWAGANPGQRAVNCTFFTLTANPTPPTCNGANNGIASVNISGGVGPFTFIWVGGPTTQSWPNVGAGTYTVIVFDQGQGGAACNIDVFINEPGPLTVFAMNAVAPTCFGACNGSAFPIVIGGAGGYTLTWPNGVTGFSNSSLCNPFTLNITDASGCSVDTTFVFQNEPQEIIIEAEISPILCNGETNGAIDITITGGSPNFTFNWTGPNGFSSNSEDISALAAGSYTIEVTDQNGCTADATFEIIEPDPLVLTPTIINNECASDSIASIELIVSGGTTPYSFSWTGPNGYTSSNQNIFNLITGTYNLQLTDSNNCQLNASYEITAAPEIDITISITDITCSGADDGAITAEASGGTGIFAFEWSGPNGFTSISQNISGLAAGTYTLTVTDDSGCSNTATADITESAVLTLNTTFTNVTCADANDGTIELNISGGTPDYTIVWSGPNGFTSNNQNLNSLAEGVYTVEVTDANNCTENTQVTITAPTVIVLNFTTGDVICAGQDNGFANLNISGGQPDYIIVWSGPNGFASNNQNITNLAAGNYTVNVVDAANCLQSGQVTINESDPIVVDATLIPPGCGNSTDGSIELVISGGNPSLDINGNPIYNVSWTGPNGFSATTANITGLEAGDYEVTVQDDSGCETTTSFQLIAPEAIELNATVNGISCLGGDGSIDLSISGGTPTYTIAWTGPNGFNSNAQNIANLNSGTYSVTVTDLNNCIENALFEVDDVQPIDITASLTNVQCQGVFDGSITLELNGGSPPYTFQWVGPGGFSSTDQDIFDLQSGNYTLVITDNEGCITNSTYTLTENLGLTVQGEVTDADCANNNDGSITVTITGGTEPYSSFWEGPNGYTNSGTTITGLAAGVYIFIVTDVADCFVEQPFTVSNPADVEINASVTNLICNGALNGAIEVEITSGSAQTISWEGPNGFTSNDLSIFGLSGGTYILTLTDDNDCVLIEAFSINEPTAIDLSIIDSQPSCGLGNGQVVSSISGGTPPYTYLWTNQFNEVIGDGTIVTNLSAGTYTLLVTDQNNCTATQSAVLTETDLVVDAVLTPASCGGYADGAIDIAISGGQTPYIVTWSGPNGFSSSDEDLINLVAGDYNLTIIDGLGCSHVEMFSISEPDPIVIDFSSTNIACFGQNNGTITTNISGGNPGYTIAWTGPNGFNSNALNLSNLLAGVYNITVQDDNGCEVTDSVEITENNELTATVNDTQLSCSGQNDGALSVNISGGTLPYIVIWSGPNGFNSNNPSISNLEAGTYLLVVTDFNNCLFTNSYVLTAPTSIDVDAALTPAGCLGQNAGSIILTITGGTEPYTFVWSGPNGFSSISQNISNLAEGDYMVEITDDNGCSAIQSYTVIGSIPLFVDAELNDVLCQGVFDGFINLTLSGGSPGFSFGWSGPNGYTATDQNINGLEAGDYTVIITDNLGCTQTETYTLIEIEGLEVDATITDADCVNNNNGSITVVVTGGSPPYSIFWQGPNGFTANELSISGLEAGVYTFVATDAADCFIEIPLIVNNPSSVTIVEEITNVLCNGANNGAITLTLNGVAGPITISWTGPNGFSSSDQNINNLAAGTYTLTIIDQDGCLLTEIFEITEPAVLIASVAVTQPSCGLSNGQLVASVSGGTPAYQILWTDELNTPIGTDPILSGLSAGIYTLTVGDDNGCTYTETFELINSDLIIDATVNQILCFGDNSGAVSLNISGGTQPYTVVWSGPNGFTSNNPAITSLAPGIYNVTIEDDSNCSSTLTFEITEPTLLELTAGAGPSTCQQANGFVSAIISGGTITSGYAITWFDNNNNVVGNTATITDLSAGIYTVVVSDDNGCEVTEQVSISDSDGTIDAAIISPTCGGASNGSISIIITGGTEPYSFEWNGPNGFTSTDQNISGLEAGVYNVTVSDFAGCVFTDIFDLTEPAPFALNIDVTAVTCFGDANGSITLNIGGGTSPYTISWSGPNGFTSDQQSLSDLAVGIYTVEVTDSLLCVSSATAVITAPEELTATLTVTNNLCAGDSLGSINTTVLGGNAPYTFQWISASGFTADNQNISGLPAGIYELLVTDSLGCFNQFIAEVSSNPAIAATYIASSSNCFGENNGLIEATVTGGTPDYTYSWTGPNGFAESTATISNLVAGTYFITVLDSNFCLLQDSIILTQPDSIFTTIAATDILCFSNDDGTIEATISGGTAPYASQWSGPNGFSSTDLMLNDLLPGNYILVVTDSLGCTTQSEVVIASPDELEVTLVNAVDALCNTDNSGSIEVLVSGGTEPYIFVWSGPNGFVSVEQNPANLIPGTYTLALTDSNGCATQLEVEIGFAFEISADAGVDFSLCFDAQPIVLSGASVNATDVQWLNPQGVVISDEATVETLSVPGTFTYYFEVSNGLCTAIDSISVTILSLPNVTAGIPETIYEGESATLGGFPTGPAGSVFSWTPGATLSDSTAANPIASPLVTTLYTVTVIDANGCTGIDSVLITVIPDIRFPSGITPNGDGYNETWVIDYIDLYPNNVVEVYNRWGDRLYRAEGYDNSNGWDGYFNGKALPVGTYYFIVELNDERYPEPFTGPITIFR